MTLTLTLALALTLLPRPFGQISHVFSDKTGTLTENIMDFRKCTVGGRSYGKGMTEIGLAALKVKSWG
ncbi:unnamed protein product [Discosporangium mesarthrocarpum]